MTISIRRMTTGSGYRYLMDSVARGDGAVERSSPLTRYYAESGTPPGRFMGAGLAGLRDGLGVPEGSEVTEAMLRNMLQLVVDPVTGQPLGKVPKAPPPTHRELVQAPFDKLAGIVSVAERRAAVARLRQVQGVETERDKRPQPVAGFDLTVSVPKSISAAWAVADAGTQAVIYEAHQEAIRLTLAYAEQHVFFSRSGTNGVVQEPVRGVVAAGFDHWDSRAGDPQLHTHVVVLNRAQSLDGTWRTLDSRGLFKQVVTLSELHEGILADVLTERLGWGFDPRQRNYSAEPKYEVTGVSDALMREFFQRSVQVDADANTLIAQFIAAKGRRPSDVEVTRLRQQATLASRPDKQHHCLAEQTGTWRQRARPYVGADTVAWVESLAGRNDLPRLRADDLHDAILRDAASVALERVAQKRSTFTRANLLAEIHRQLHGVRFAAPSDRITVGERTADLAELAALRLTPPELQHTPGRFQRADGTSRFRGTGATIFTTQALLDAEERLLDAGRTSTAPVLDRGIIAAVAETNLPGKTYALSSDQAVAVESIATSGRVLDVLVGPAGTGKSSSMAGLRAMWEQQHGPGSVIGLAPSAAAAEVLANEGAGDERRFGPGYFDLVIIDEAHRSVYQKYKAICSWFDSLLVGLTATPKTEIDRNTYSLFHLEDGVPTDNYPLDAAVAEGFLVPPRAVSVPLKFQREGIRYDELSEAEKDQWDTLDWDEDGDVPDLVAADAVNKWLFNTDTVDKMLATLMTQGHHVAGGDRLGKTIIFAKNNHHATFIRERFDANYPEYAGHFARVITYKTEYPQSLIDDFCIKVKAPHIAISVDMLDTGIDVPEVVNLIFFKIVRSKTKFWQMLGRGTRLCPDLYGPGDDKADFYIFDFCGNLEFFNAHPETVDGHLAESLAQRLFKARLELITGIDTRIPANHTSSTDQVGSVPGGDDAGTDGTGSEAGLRMDLAHVLHDIVVGMNVDNFVVRPQRRLVETYYDLQPWLELTPTAAGQVAEHLSGLPTAVRDEDEQAKRFDLLILRLQLCVLGAEPGFDRLREQVRQIATALLEVTNIPAVGAQQDLLDEVAGEDWWVDVTLPMLELLRRRVRGLVKLIEKSRRLIVYTDFADQLGDATEVTLSGVPVGTDLQRFLAKARMYLRAHQDDLALQKLRRNKALTAADLAELERMLAESGVGAQADIDHARDQAHGLGLFIRGLVGLERDAATDALSGFIAARTLNASQLDFLNLIVNYLTEHGVMDVGRLYESPFTELAPSGPETLFNSEDIDALQAALAQISATAQVTAVA